MTRVGVVNVDLLPLCHFTVNALRVVTKLELRNRF